MKKTLLTIVQLVVFVGLGVFIIYWKAGELSADDKAKMYESMRTVNLWMLIPLVGVGFLSHWFRALRWRLLLEPMHIRPSKTNTTISVLIGYLVNLFVPRMGEVAKCTVLARYEKVPADKMVGTIVAERAFDMVCLLIISVLAFSLQWHAISDYAAVIRDKFFQKTNTLVVAGIAGIALIALLVYVYRRNRNSKVGRFIKGMGDGVRSILKLKKRGLFLFYTLMIWSMYLLMLVLGFWSMPVTQGLPILTALVVLVFGSIGMIVTQGGIGAYPVLVGKVLTRYGLDEPSGLAFGWVSWIVQTFIVLLLGFIALFFMFAYNRKVHHYDYVETGVDTE
ncbi:lysylphosphatidylglycerol synthase transmembrane domain-containing protein [Chitinophagaceae bacterium MMS25-I14]